MLILFKPSFVIALTGIDDHSDFSGGYKAIIIRGYSLQDVLSTLRVGHGHHTNADWGNAETTWARAGQNKITRNLIKCEHWNKDDHVGCWVSTIKVYI